MRNRLPVVLFVLGLMFFAFLYGMAAGHFRLFPFKVFERARLAADALMTSRSSTPNNQYVFDNRAGGTGVTIHDLKRAFFGYTLFTAFQDTGCSNILIDMEGRTVHRWYVAFSDVWKKAPFLMHQRGDAWTNWHGKVLLANGDLIASFVGTGFPKGYGTVRLDRQSHVVWALPRGTHHDVHLGYDGRLYIPSLVYHTKESLRVPKMSRPDGTTVWWSRPLEEDFVLVVSADGQVEKEISILSALRDSPYRGLLSVTFRRTLDVAPVHDPTHLNNVELVTEAFSRKNPSIAPGDLLVSLRNMSTIAVIDKHTDKVKWALVGPFVRQHDPDQLPNGNLLIYDNWGGDPKVGASRVIEIDPLTQRIEWCYTGTAKRPFFSKIRGSQQRLPNGNVLITEPEGGRVFEVTHDATPRIVWEYVNADPAGLGEGRVGIVIGATRYAPEDLPFLAIP
ncbi:MAG: arylsulfotransferase family protein [Pirellulaceae bacterium]